MINTDNDTDLDSLDQDYVDKGTQDAENYANEGSEASGGRQQSTKRAKTPQRESPPPRKTTTKDKRSSKHLPSFLPPRNIEEAVKEFVKKSIYALIFNPLVLVILAILIIILFIFFIIFVGENDLEKQAQGNSLAISKSGPTEAQVGQNLTYQIAVTYNQSAEEITITDTLPQGTDYVSSDPAGTYDAGSRTITWSAKALSLPLTAPIAINISLTLKATQNNLNIVNIAQAAATPASGGGGPLPAGYVPPSTDNCGGKYKFTSPLKKNFGDPACNFTKDQLYTLLKQQDAGRADLWFNKVVPCESSYNPNAYAGPQTGTPDARGAWGLYQMGSSYPPGSPPPAPGKNGPNDRGDVDWYTQTVNATTYGKKLSSLGSYWACAR